MFRVFSVFKTPLPKEINLRNGYSFYKDPSWAEVSTEAGTITFGGGWFPNSPNLICKVVINFDDPIDRVNPEEVLRNYDQMEWASVRVWALIA